MLHTKFEFDLRCFFIGAGNGNTPRKPQGCDQKAVKNCIRYDHGSHPLPLGFEYTATALNTDWLIHLSAVPPSCWHAFYVVVVEIDFNIDFDIV